jgi:hypothetical protein
MRPQVISKTSAGTTAWIPVDYKQNPFNVGFGVVATGTLTYDIEHTFDDIFDSTVTPTAFKHATVVGQTASKDGNYSAPVRAVRLNVTAFTSGSATLTLLQGLR